MATEHANNTDPSPIAQIHEALSVVHSPCSTNDARQQAGTFLEELKLDKNAPYHGFTLASDKSQQPVVRHYALSLIENAIRHKWFDYSDEDADVLRQWVMQLSEQIVADDPLYIRNKTAQLWVEVAKRSWGNQWINMDEMLVQLWETGSVVHKEFVLFVLENLSDEVFNKEDGSAAMREAVLSKACVEIFTPAQVLQEAFPNRITAPAVRFGTDGWLVRLGLFLEQCIDSGVQDNGESRSCAVKILAVFKSVLPWAIPRAIAAASCVSHICQSLAAPDVKVQVASVEALHALYSRPHLSDEEYQELVCPIFLTQRVDLLRRIYEWSIVDPQDIDEEKYLLSKKFSEMMSKLGNFLEQYQSFMPPDIDLPNLLNLFFSIVQNQSFVVAIPVLVTWTHLLRSEAITEKANHLIAPLLQLCSSRLVRYEQLPEDSEDPSLVLLLEDIDTIPERHAFLGNYRRYNVAVIEQIVRRKTADAIYHILSQVWQTLEHLYDHNTSFSVENYSKNSPALLQVDGQLTVMEAALKGYIRWRDGAGDRSQEHEAQRQKMEDDFQAWCERLLALNFEDPLIRRRILQLAVQFATSILDRKPAFMLVVLDNILNTRPQEVPEHRAYTDAVKELKTDLTHELSRLGSKMPDQLLEVYDELEAKIAQIVAAGGLDERQSTSYQTFLFSIIHRAKGINPDARMARLHSIIQPVVQSWQNPALTAVISSFGGFCDILGMGKVNDYLVSRQVHKIADWGTFDLDEEGLAIQTELQERVKSLPLRQTKAFLSSSTERIAKNSDIHKTTCALWADSIPILLPDLLKLLEHAHAFNNPQAWAGLPAEMQPIVPRILTDRFWQSGISGGSRDDFFARVSGTRTTMEGMASSIRGTVRAVREAAYSILFSMSKMNSHFYGFNGLSQPLAEALFTNAPFLSSNQLITLLGLTRGMVDECPPELRQQFVPPILSSCFRQTDIKITSAWAALDSRQQQASAEDELTEEMKEESLLRQLTNTAVMMVASLFDPHRLNGIHSSRYRPPLLLRLAPYNTLLGLPASNTPSAEGAESVHPVKTLDQYDGAYGPGSISLSQYPTIRRFCLTDASILEPLMVFSSHAIRMRDTRSCGVILRVFRSIVPEFASTRDPGNPTNIQIREYISTDVLKNAISSLHEPYYVDLQKDIAQLIATIMVSYCGLTETPKQVLCSLPGIREDAVDRCIEYLERMGVQQRQQRALVLDLLREVKGVSINEMGKIRKVDRVVRKERTRMQEEFMMSEEQRRAVEAEKKMRQPSPELEGVGDMFGGQ